MARNFPDFLKVYYEYAVDEYCPPIFHHFAGVSAIAGALERKVWVQQNNIVHYPNMFVILTAIPGDGKSTAADRAVELLRELSSESGLIAFTPPAISKAAFHSHMVGIARKFYVGAYEHIQSPAFYYAEEASNAITAIKGGDEIYPLMTQAYDCKAEMSKLTKSNNKGEAEIVRNPCLNILACSTYDALGRILSEAGVMGGFGSRCVIVPQTEQMVRTPKWLDDAAMKEEGALRRLDPRFAKLVADLQEMHQLTGRFVPTKEYRAAFEAWFPHNDRERYARTSEREQAMFARKHTNVIKLSMIYSAAESSEMILTAKHWDLALEQANWITAKYQEVLQRIMNPNDQAGVNGIIKGLILGSGGRIPESALRNLTVARGNVPVHSAEATINHMLKTGALTRDVVGARAYVRFPSKAELHIISGDSGHSEEEAAVSGSLPDGVEEDLSRG